jgi:hypothetical protein
MAYVRMSRAEIEANFEQLRQDGLREARAELSRCDPTSADAERIRGNLARYGGRDDSD